MFHTCCKDVHLDLGVCFMWFNMCKGSVWQLEVVTTMTTMTMVCGGGRIATGHGARPYEMCFFMGVPQMLDRGDT